MAELYVEKAAVIDFAGVIKQQMIASFYNLLGVDMWDAAVGAIFGASYLYALKQGPVEEE